MCLLYCVCVCVCVRVLIMFIFQEQRKRLSKNPPSSFKKKRKKFNCEFLKRHLKILNISTADEGELDPMDPAAYSDAPRLINYY